MSLYTALSAAEMDADGKWPTDDSGKGDVERPILELTLPLTAYLLGLIERDLAMQGSGLPPELTRDDVAGLAHFLADFLHEVDATAVAGTAYHAIASQS